MRVCAYCRVSTDKSDQLNSMKNQVDFFAKYIESKEDWTLHKIYCDEGISGTQTKKRRQFNQMITDAKNGEIDLILTKEISRFGRNTVDVLNYTRLLKSYKTYVFFINDGINTAQNDGEIRLAIMSSIAQDESRKISERVKFGQNQSMKNGVVFGNGNLHGYKLLDGKLSINMQEKQEIRDIFCMYALEHESMAYIAKALSKSGKKWSAMSVSNVLKNEKYVGDLCQKKSVTEDYLTHHRKINLKGKIYRKNHHEAIISRKLWELTQKEREKRAKNGKFSTTHCFSGKIKCGTCAAIYTLKRNRKEENYVYEYWRSGCNCKSGKSSIISAKTVDLAVQEAIKFEKIDFGKRLNNVVKLVESENKDIILNKAKNINFLASKVVKSEVIKEISIFDDRITIEFTYKEDTGKYSYYFDI